MSEYRPDRWVVVEFDSPKHGIYRKVLASWYGGFAGSDTWKLSSGVTNVEDKGNYWLVHNESGSKYYCHKEAEGLSSLSYSIYCELESQSEVKVSLIENFSG
jgi:hypothetical protein